MEDEREAKRIKLEGGGAAPVAQAPADAQADEGSDPVPAAAVQAGGAQQQQRQQQQQTDSRGQPASDGGGAAGMLPAPMPPPDAPPETYANRERRLQQREAAGELEALYVTNDGSVAALRLLVGLKNVFSKCLPNMPKEYIARLIWNWQHRSVVIARRARPEQENPQVIGGITYRVFPAQRLGEIAFCAVAQTLQVTGFGTRLMNWTKHYARARDGVEFFLTYADNNAVGYFSKQGFTKQLTVDKERWSGFIKDYDGGTLMECRIHPSLPFVDFPRTIERQKAALDAEVRKYSSGHVVHPGLRHWREGGGPIEAEDIAGVVEAGWAPQPLAYRLVLDGATVDPTPDNLFQFLLGVLKKCQRHEDAGPFNAPVDGSIVTDYYAIILNPVDMGTMEKRLLARNYYLMLDLFAADMERMLNNCRIYNGRESPYTKCAERVYTCFQRQLEAGVVHCAAGAGDAAAAPAH